MTSGHAGAGVVVPDRPEGRPGIGRIVAVATTWQVLGVVAWVLSPAGQFLNAALCGSLALCLFVEPALGRLGRTLLFGLGFALLWAANHPGLIGEAFRQPDLIGALLGLGGLAESALHPPKERIATVASFGIPFSATLAALVLIPMGSGSPMTQDAILLEADRAFGGLPSYAMGTFLAAHPLLATLAWLTYKSLPLEVAVVVLVAVRRALPEMRPGPILSACALAALLGIAAYWTCPATGPHYAFPGFPTVRPDPLPLTRVAVSPEFPRNAMPSLHFAWAWLLWRAARPLRWLRYVTLVCLIGVAVATLGFGEHYVVDLLVAVPFAVAVEAAVAGTGWVRVAAGLLATTAWLLLFRAGDALSQPVAWAGLVGTLAISLWVAPRHPFAARPAAGVEPGK